MSCCAARDSLADAQRWGALHGSHCGVLCPGIANAVGALAGPEAGNLCVQAGSARVLQGPCCFLFFFHGRAPGPTVLCAHSTLLTTFRVVNTVQMSMHFPVVQLSKSTRSPVVVYVTCDMITLNTFESSTNAVGGVVVHKGCKPIWSGHMLNAHIDYYLKCMHVACDQAVMVLVKSICFYHASTGSACEQEFTCTRHRRTRARSVQDL